MHRSNLTGVEANSLGRTRRADQDAVVGQGLPLEGSRGSQVLPAPGARRRYVSEALALMKHCSHQTIHRLRQLCLMKGINRTSPLRMPKLFTKFQRGPVSVLTPEGRREFSIASRWLQLADPEADGWNVRSTEGP